MGDNAREHGFHWKIFRSAFRRRPSSEQAGNPAGDLPPGAAHRLVKRELYPVHIFLIIISGTIGMGLFHNSGEVLSIAGPVGGLIAYVIVGIAVVCIMEGIAEMIGHWPIANAMVEFVKAFVDKDLAIVVGIAYWYAYSISFAILIIAAANLAGFWDWSTVLQNFLFIGGAPILLLVINCLGVFWYGNVESVLGALKIMLMIGAFLAMCAINNKDVGANTPTGQIKQFYIDEGFQNNPYIAKNHATAVLVAIPIITYAYIGVEIVAVTALEAKNPRVSLKYPAKLIAWLTLGFYFFSALGFYLNVHWKDPLLPVIRGRNENANSLPESSSNATQTSSIAVIAVLNAHIPNLPGFVNICLIMAVLSASNTALYVASRTLFGLTREISPNDKYWWWLSKLSTTSYERKVPAAALFTSAVAFCWLPFLHLTKNYTLNDLQNLMSGMATVAVVLVWGILCLAFIRYRLWLRRFKDGPHLRDERPQYNHWTPGNKNVPFTTILGWLQPIPAYFGLVFCFLTVFVFATAGWWNGKAKAIDILTAFVGPAFLFIIWLILKFLRWGDNFEWYVKLGSWEELQIRLDCLEAAIVTDVVLPPDTTEEGDGVFEMNDTEYQHSYDHSSQGGTGGTLILNGGSRNSGYITPRWKGLSVGVGGEETVEVHEMRRTPSPRTRPVEPQEEFGRHSPSLSSSPNSRRKPEPSPPQIVYGEPGC